MATVSTCYEVDDDDLALVLQPRDDTVREVASDSCTFALDDGPFERYERRVEVESLGGGRHRITETTSFKLAILYFGPLFTGLYKRTLRRRSPGSTAIPWWAPPDRLSVRSTQVLSLLCVLSIVTGYLGSIISQTLTFSADEFQVDASAQGQVLAAVRLGAVLTLGIIALADRKGRRIVLIGGAVAGCIFAAAGALAPGIAVLATTQTLSRACSLSLGVLILIVAAEEMPAGSRAYAVSVTTMTGALGAGVVLFLLPIADTGEAAWRIIYLVPLLALVPILRLGRILPETQRFTARAARDAAEAAAAERGETSPPAAHAAVPPVGVEVGGPDDDDWVLIEEVGAAGGGVQSTSGRFWMLAWSAFLGALLFAPATQFQNEFLRDERGFSAAGITVYTLLTGTPGGIGIVVGGRLADTFGRRRVGALALLGGALFTALRFVVGGPMLWIGGILGSIIGAAAVPTLGVYGPELFPTDKRGSANGGITLFGVAGSVFALLLVGYLADQWDDLGLAIAVTAIGPVLLAILIWVAYPETANLELEEINPEDRDLELADDHPTGEAPPAT